MKNLRRVQEKVFKALTEKPETRADDYLLVLEVYKHYISAEMSFSTVLERHIELGLPSFASISRIRRKLQKQNPELTNATAAAMREEERKEYEAYAINS